MSHWRRAALKGTEKSLGWLVPPPWSRLIHRQTHGGGFRDLCESYRCDLGYVCGHSELQGGCAEPPGRRITSRGRSRASYCDMDMGIWGGRELRA